ncbi:hypothetical protein BDK89_1701 [Ilumatobacter fluminis]|uniref:STAS domain-containing protein n=1 Tax=Ilumatobacter fluminis TaxID=467091 RepID=A0A4R7HZY2_9ACTN|nr:hypothetical protein [Ilumatobacter fluminis]TDT16119.1 hypothetical protein BDK89_1701 [Ilumatobacter fluminis]
MNLPSTQTTRRRLHHTWERFQERRKQLSAAVAAKRPPRSVQTPELQYRLAHVADPHGTGSILAVQGLLNAAAIEAVHDATVVLPADSRLDLDLSGAAILSGPWLRMLEALIDALEERGVQVRVTGISPHHPELRRH